MTTPMGEEPTYDPESIKTFEDDPSLEQTHKNMIETGHAVEEYVEIDYFGFGSEERWYFPGQSRVPEDQKQYFTVKKMNEGAKAEYQKKTNKDVRIQRTTGDARLSMDTVEERHTLIRLSVTGARVKRRMPDGTLRFDDKKVGQILREWLATGNPDHVQSLERFIRELNPWMRTDMTNEEIDNEIDRLKELKKEKEREESEN